MTNLLQLGNFTSHSGLKLWYKIECDALTDEDWHCLAHMAKRVVGKFVRADYAFYVGVPTGGGKLAHYLNKMSHRNGQTVVVDDVLTTGSSILQHMNVYKSPVGIVVFSRGRVESVNANLCTHGHVNCPHCPRVHALFQLNPLVN